MFESVPREFQVAFAAVARARSSTAYQSTIITLKPLPNGLTEAQKKELDQATLVSLPFKKIEVVDRKTNAGDRNK
jgi:hypothetical protein